MYSFSDLEASIRVIEDKLVRVKEDELILISVLHDLKEEHEKRK